MSKTVLFVLIAGINGLCTFLLLPNNAGFAGRFGNDESFIRSQGFPTAGLLANIIAFICIFFSSKMDKKYQFMIYLFICDVGLFFHFINMKTFFKDCQKNLYAISSKNTDLKEEKSGEFDLQKQNLKIELLDQMKKDESESSSDKDQDYNQTSDCKTLSILDNLKSIWDLYLGSIINFVLFLAIFPLIAFKIDVSDLVSSPYKYIFHTLLLNIGEFIGRSIYVDLPINSHKICYLFLFIRGVGVLIFYSMCSLSTMSQYYSIYVKIPLILMYYMFYGYSLNMFVDLGQKYFKGRPYDIIRYGEMRLYFIQFGIFLGTFFSSKLI